MKISKTFAGLTAVGAAIAAIVARTRIRGRKPAAPASPDAESKTQHDTTSKQIEEQPVEELTVS